MDVRGLTDGEVVRLKDPWYYTTKEYSFYSFLLMAK
jgi:hypothetical protein